MAVCRIKEAVVITDQDDLEEHLLIDLHELLVPLVDISIFLSRVGFVIIGRGRIVLVMGAPFDDLLQHCGVDIRDGDGFGDTLFAKVADHVLDEDRSLSDFAFCFRALMPRQ